MTQQQVKSAIRDMKAYDINILNQLSQQSGIHIMVIGFWWNAIKN